jgi:hypothetical protein
MRKVRALLIAGAMVLGAVAASAVPAGAVPTKVLSADLGAAWSTVLQAPSAESPFGTGGIAYSCVDIGDAVAPFGPEGAPACTVKPGTKIFAAAYSWECSTYEGNGTTEAELRACAEANNLPVAPEVTLDGKDLPMTRVQTSLLHLVVPADNLFGVPAGTSGLSVADGWVALVHPLTPGTHEITITVPGFDPLTTVITVEQ